MNCQIPPTSEIKSPTQPNSAVKALPLERWPENISADKVTAQPSRQSQLMPVKMRTSPRVMKAKYIADFIFDFARIISG